MVINDKEAEDLGLTRELMWRRFRKNKPVYIGSIYWQYKIYDNRCNTKYRWICII